MKTTSGWLCLYDSYEIKPCCKPVNQQILPPYRQLLNTGFQQFVHSKEIDKHTLIQMENLTIKKKNYSDRKIDIKLGQHKSEK